MLEHIKRIWNRTRGNNRIPLLLLLLGLQLMLIHLDLQVLVLAMQVLLLIMKALELQVQLEALVSVVLATR